MDPSLVLASLLLDRNRRPIATSAEVDRFYNENGRVFGTGILKVAMIALAALAEIYNKRDPILRFATRKHGS
ncbi:hypothetical protein [uncultured Roseibium sp.]|uniref:hypothetical protein n=1 Tax=uncultured Roseibium sp. TaxID=1936171 RepID=UPI0026017417|nr:hypothetical protein [uncultured Roseibium sp.]